MATTMAMQAAPMRVMDASKASASDVCPVCKSMAQTSPNLRFKISSKCYHRICEGCVDRKFSAGKAQCPISGCAHMLWKRDWRLQTFEDVKVEREVDIRKKIWRTLDLAQLGLKKQDDEEWDVAFEDARSYDDFLELREELAMNLITSIDVNATNKKLRDFETANGLKKDKDDGRPLVKPVYREGENPDASGLIRGLKPRRLSKVKALFDPWVTVQEHRDYYTVQPKHPTLFEQQRKNKDFNVAGYDFDAYMDESLLRSFAGLGVFVEDKVSGQNGITSLPASGPAKRGVKEVF